MKPDAVPTAFLFAKQRRSLSAAQTTSILKTLLKATAVGEIPAEIRRHCQVGLCIVTLLQVQQN